MDEPQLSQDECRAVWWIYIPQQALSMVNKASGSQGSRTGLDPTPTGKKGGACLSCDSDCLREGGGEWKEEILLHQMML